QNAVAELGDLQAVANDDRILADKIDAADMAVEIDADTRPVEAGGHLLDMSRLAGAMIACNHDAAVTRKASQDRERGRPVEQIVGIEIGNMGVRLGISRDFEIGID